MAVMSFHSSTPLLWPVWYLFYVVLCTVHSLPVLISGLPGIVSLESGLPAFDINASLHLGAEAAEKFGRGIPGFEEVFSPDHSADWVAGALLFGCVSVAICDWLSGEPAQD